jgi:CubicO group peptidase (beta-lactamase class C family)
MNRRAFLSGLATGVLSAWHLSADADSAVKSTWEPHSSNLEAQIPDLMRTTNVPGLSLAVFRRGRIVWLRGFGVRDRAFGVPVDTGTLFEAASMSKPLFAYVVLKLCEKGTLELDTPLTHYTKRRLLDDPRLKLIAARHILSHSSVLSHSSGLVPDWRSADQPLKIAFTPGEKWSYSGEGYYYLQSIITELTGRTDPSQCDTFEAGLKVCATNFGEYMESKLVVPLGMRSSGYFRKEWFDSSRARPHDVKGNPLPYRSSRAVDLARYGAAGGLITTPGDYAKFMMEVIDPKPRNDFHLSASSLKEMMTPQVEVVRTGDDVVSWGLGWRIAHTPREVYFGHGGENPGFQCISEACAADRSGFVAMTNGDNGPKLLEKLAPEISTRLHS